MKRILLTVLLVYCLTVVPAAAGHVGGFEGNYFWTADDAIITFTYRDFHQLLDQLGGQQLDAYQQKFERWEAHMPGGPIYVEVLKEYHDGILKVKSVEGGYEFFIFRDYLLAEF